MVMASNSTGLYLGSCSPKGYLSISFSADVFNYLTQCLFLDVTRDYKVLSARHAEPSASVRSECDPVHPAARGPRRAEHPPLRAESARTAVPVTASAWGRARKPSELEENRLDARQSEERCSLFQSFNWEFLSWRQGHLPNSFLFYIQQFIRLYEISCSIHYFLRWKTYSCWSLRRWCCASWHASRWAAINSFLLTSSTRFSTAWRTAPILMCRITVCRFLLLFLGYLFPFSSFYFLVLHNLPFKNYSIQLFSTSMM